MTTKNESLSSQPREQTARREPARLPEVLAPARLRAAESNSVRSGETGDSGRGASRYTCFAVVAGDNGFVGPVLSDAAKGPALHDGLGERQPA